MISRQRHKRLMECFRQLQLAIEAAEECLTQRSMWHSRLQPFLASFHFKAT